MPFLEFCRIADTIDTNLQKATTMMSRRPLNNCVVAWRRSFSSSSLMDRSFFDISITDGHVGLGLIIIVIGNEIADGIVGEETV